MSKNKRPHTNKEKQQKEMHCLRDALQANMTPKTIEILDSVLETPDDWMSGWVAFDRPDLYRCVGNTVIGIEHFSVDSFSEQKAGSIQSLTGKTLSELDRLVDRNKDHGANNGNMLEALISATNIASDVFWDKQRVEDKYALLGLCEGLFGKDDKKGHAQKVNGTYGADEKSYRNRLQEEFPTKKIRVGLLIEFIGDYSQTILFKDGKYCLNESGIIPISHELLAIFSHALSMGVDFIIFFRKQLSFDMHAIKADRTFVMDQAIPIGYTPGYIHGEPVYTALRGAQARNLCISRQTHIRHRGSTAKTDIVLSVSGNLCVDLLQYWKLVYNGINIAKHNGFYCADIDLASIIYALSLIPHVWVETEFRNEKKGTSEKGISPCGFNLIEFYYNQLQFLYRFENRINSRSQYPGFELSTFQSAHKAGLDDNSDGSWELYRHTGGKGNETN